MEDVAGAVRLSVEGGAVWEEGQAEDPGNTRGSGADAGKGLRQGPWKAERRGPGCDDVPQRASAKKNMVGSAGCHQDKGDEGRRRSGVRGSQALGRGPRTADVSRPRVGAEGACGREGVGLWDIS